MANTIKTRILLRNDALSNWLDNNSVELGKGELAIATLSGGTLAEVRIGTGNSKFSESLKLNIGTDQVSGLTEMIESLVGNGAKKYQVVANGEGGNSWKLQNAPLSAADDEWTDVAGSTWTVDFSAITEEIEGLTADVSYLSGQIDATNATLNTVSSDYLKATDFAALSNEIGLSAASGSNQVVTKKDIADLAGAMHFKGAVTSLTEIQSAEPGDVVIIPSTSKEYVYNSEAEAAYSIDNWVELGDEVLYATKAEVSAYALKTEAAEMSAYAYGQASAYTDAEIAKLSIGDYALSADVDTLVAEVSAAAVSEANGYTDTAIQGLDVADDEAGNQNAGFVTIVTEADGKIAVTKKTIELSDITDVADISANIGLSDYALSADVTTLVSETSAATIDAVVGESTDLSSADTINGAKAYATDYADAKVDELSSGFLILDCGNASLRTDEPTAPLGS